MLRNEFATYSFVNLVNLNGINDHNGKILFTNHKTSTYSLLTKYLCSSIIIRSNSCKMSVDTIKYKALKRSNGRGPKQVKIRLYLPVFIFSLYLSSGRWSTRAHRRPRACADRDLRLRPRHAPHLPHPI